MKRIVVADDLTGASDAGVQFAKRGERTTVRLDAAGPWEESDPADVVVVDLDSRAETPAVAYARMRAFAAHLPARLLPLVVKKMDSTLRGNLGPEMRALLEARPAATAIVCPAYPKNRRTVVDGAVYVAGVPLDRTDFARDLFSPVRDARIAAHLDTDAVLIPLATVLAGTAAIRRAVADARRAGVRVCIADAQTDADLSAVASIAGFEDELLWVGSAGLIEVLDAGAVAAGGVPGVVLPATGPVVFLIGSLSTMTQRQIAAFGAHGVVVVLDPAAVARADPAVRGALAPATAAVARGDDVLVALDGSPAAVSAAVAEAGSTAAFRAASRRLRELFVAAAAPLWQGRPGSTIVLSGGDIARTFCDAHGIRRLSVLAETAPGIPVSRAMGADYRLVTKAGGFGEPGTYREILSTLRRGAIA